MDSLPVLQYANPQVSFGATVIGVMARVVFLLLLIEIAVKFTGNGGHVNYQYTPSEISFQYDGNIRDTAATAYRQFDYYIERLRFAEGGALFALTIIAFSGRHQVAQRDRIWILLAWAALLCTRLVPFGYWSACFDPI